MANVTGAASVTPTFTQTPATGVLAGNPLSMSASISAAFKAAGVLADQVDGVHAKDYTFVATTPQNLDLMALTDVLGNALTFARLRFIAFQVTWNTDNVPLLVGGAGTNEYTGFLTTGGKISVFPSSSANSGFLILAAPQTTGIGGIDATHKLVKMDPQSASGIVRVIAAGCSS